MGFLGLGSQQPQSFNNALSGNVLTVGGQDVAMADPASQAPVKPRGDNSFFGILGKIGDTILALDGHAPIFQQRKANAAFSNFLANPGDRQAQADFIDRDPTRAYALQNQQREDALAREKMRNVQPHYWETNDGSLGAIGPDGQPRIVYKDPSPKYSFLTADNDDGTKTVYPVGPNGPVTGQQPQRPVQQQPGGSTIDAFGAKAMRESLGEQGYAQWKQRHGVTEIGASPSASAPVSQNIGGKTYYQVNGKWYDNPEGR